MNQERLLTVLLAPHLTEKSARGWEAGEYIFKVLPDANKLEIAQAVSQIFGVEVADIRVCNQKGKTKIFRRIRGRRAGFKKAYVRLMPGQSIDLAGTA